MEVRHCLAESTERLSQLLTRLTLSTVRQGHVHVWLLFHHVVGEVRIRGDRQTFRGVSGSVIRTAVACQSVVKPWVTFYPTFRLDLQPDTPTGRPSERADLCVFKRLRPRKHAVRAGDQESIRSAGS